MPTKSPPKGTPKRTPKKRKTASNSTSSRKSTAPVSKSHPPRQKSSGGGVTILFVIIIVAIAGVYLLQKQQSDSITSNISELENKLKGSLTEIQEDLAEAKEKMEEDEKPVEDVAKNYTSPVHEYTLNFPSNYIVNQVVAEPNGGAEEIVILARPKDLEELTQKSKENGGAPAEGFPMITSIVYDNPDELSALDWALENDNLSNFDEEMEYDLEEYGDLEALSYSARIFLEEDYYVVSSEDKIFVLRAAYVDEDDSIREDVVEVLKGLEI